MAYQSFSTNTRKRTTPRIQYVKGYLGQASVQGQESLPIYNSQAILSGMCISRVYDDGQWKWQLGHVAGNQPFVAHQDYTDPDVVASGKLTGMLLTPGGIEFRTGHILLGTEANWDAGAKVSAVLFDNGTAANRGKFKLAASGEDIVGQLAGAHKDGLIDVASENTEVTPVSGVVAVAQIQGAFVTGNTMA